MAVRRSAGLERLEHNRKKRQRMFIVRMIILAVIMLAIIGGIIWGICAIVGSFTGGMPANADGSPQMRAEQLLQEANVLAAGYDYDKAIEKIQSFGEKYTERPELVAAIEGYEETKATMVEYPDVHDIPHIFFHSLIVDNARCFDGEYTEGGYNQYMTTVSEFNKIMEEMYKKGFVLVDIHDVAHEETQTDGSTKFVAGKIMLPKDKKPFVMSQDDVNYYEYMKTDGFADKILIGEDGKPTCQYTQADGTVVTGDYDLVPLLDRFIENHPDFSYRGARAALALTGYEGVFGYRSRPDSPTYEEDAAAAKKVADRLKELGWTLASHSWGHRLYGQIGAATLKTDAQRWEDEVQPIVGDTDVLIYAYGNDIAGIGKYTGEKYETLKSMGFKYFCNVDSAQSWLQIHDEYVRQGRRNLDGYRMYYNPEMLDDLFDVKDVWDSSRPTPVPKI